MKTLVTVFAVACILHAPCTSSAVESLDRDLIRTKSFIVSYPSVINENHKLYRTVFMEQKYLELFADGLSEIFKISPPIILGIEECQQANAFYNPTTNHIVMCYELLDSFEKAFAHVPQSQQNQAVMGSWTFVFFHEIGHALVHRLNLPITGKEEDAVDQFSTVLLTRVGQQGADAALAGAYYFLLNSARNKNSFAYWFGTVLGAPTHNFADEHSLDEQRFYNIVCWVYGQHPERYNWIVKNGTLPQRRAQRCYGESQKILSSWSMLMNLDSMKQATQNSAASSSSDPASYSTAGRIVGQVLQADGQDKLEPFSEVMLMLYPATKEADNWFSNPSSVKERACLPPSDKLRQGYPLFEHGDRKGGFVIHNLKSGAYHLCAVYTWKSIGAKGQDEREAIAVVSGIRVESGKDTQVTIK